MQKLREEESKSEIVALKKRTLNDQMMLVERSFLDADGLQGRQWFKHLVSAFPSPISIMLVTTVSVVFRKTYADELSSVRYLLNLCTVSM